MSSPSQPKKRKTPGDDKKSFVEQMAKKMTSLLPQTITQWFSSTSNENGSTQVAESTDSSTEDESTDSPLDNQPPAKRMRYNIPGPSNLYAAPETRSISTNTEPVEISNLVQSSANKSTLTSETNSAPKTSEETTVIKKNTSFVPLDQSRNPLRRRKSLFDSSTSASTDKDLNDKTTDKKTTADDVNQYLKRSLSIVSPFYPGKTKYGGASSSYIDSPNVKFTRTPNINYTPSNNDVTMSNSTKRIMDLLENFSSPTHDARRLPQITSSPVNISNQSLDSTITSKRQLSFKNNELYVPNIASILKLKQNSRLMKTTRVARQILASQSSSIDMYPAKPTRSSTPNILSDRNSFKMRSRVTKSTNMELEPTVEPVNLPKATLQIEKDNLPKFSFGIMPTPTPSSKQTDAPNNSMPKLRVISSSELKGTSTDNVNMNEKPKHDIWNLTQSDAYKFASPLNISVDGKESSQSQMFGFGRPERNVEDQFQITNQENKVPVLDRIQEEVQDTNSQDRYSEMDCSEADKCIICNANLEEGRSGKCVDCEKEKSAPSKTERLTVAAKWRCPDCWVDNEDANNKCVCCGKDKPAKPGTKNNDSQINNMNNEISTSKHITPSASNDSTLNNIVKMQSNKWECPNCLVRNDHNVGRCVCCDTEKPGCNKGQQNNTFNFGASTNVSFKFGIDPKQNFPKIEAPIPINPFSAKETETNNNQFFNNNFQFKPIAAISNEQHKSSQSIFSFGIPKEKNQNIFGMPTSSSIGFSMISPKESEKAMTEQDNKTKSESETHIFSPKPINSTASPLAGPSMPVVNQPFMTTESAANIATTSEQVASPSTFSFSSGLTQPGNLLKRQTFTTCSATSATASMATTSSDTVPFFSKNEPASSSQSMFFKTNDSELPLFPKTETVTTATQATASSSSVFNFGGNMNPQPNAEKAKFTFTFGASKSEAPTLFNAPSAFNAPVENKFNLPTSNTTNSELPVNDMMNNNRMSNTNGMPSSNPLAGLVRGNGSGPGSSMGGNGLSNAMKPVNNLMQAGSSSGTMGAGHPFGGMKTDTWPPNNDNNNTNIFDSNATNNVQKPAPFTFGATTSFNTGSAAHAFGNPTQPSQPAQTTQPPPSLFGVVSPNNQQQQPAIFPNQIQNQAAPNMFGATQPPAPSVGGMFGVQGFGQPNANQSMFNASPMSPTPTMNPTPIMNPTPPMNPTPTMNPTSAINPTPTPSFNFGAQQPRSNVFTFSQQSSLLQQQPGVYNFGGPGGPPTVQFSMGSAPNTAGRRVKKIIRRTSAR